MTTKTTVLKAPTGTALLLQAENGSRKAIIIQNTGTINVYIGGSDVLTTTGELLKPGAILRDSICTDAYYGVTAGSTANLRVTEIVANGELADLPKERVIIEPSVVVATGSSDVLGVANGGSGASSLTDHGVMLGSGTDPVTVTSAGTSGQPFVSGGASADPAFAASLGAGFGGTGITSFTAGDILYATGATTLAKLAKGTDGQVLTMVAGVPAWADLP